MNTKPSHQQHYTAVEQPQYVMLQALLCLVLPAYNKLHQTPCDLGFSKSFESIPVRQASPDERATVLG
jgi:hypothetical protein